MKSPIVEEIIKGPVNTHNNNDNDQDHSSADFFRRESLSSRNIKQLISREKNENNIQNTMYALQKIRDGAEFDFNVRPKLSLAKNQF